MTIRVNLFAAMRDLTGTDCATVELPAGTTVADLRRALADRFPKASGLLRRSAIAVNHDFAEDSQVLQSLDEVAVIPPVSGG
jgi:molybdopterin converting factor subunit 1